MTHDLREATFLADRILLMSRRPGRIFDELAITLPRPRQYDDPDVFEVSRVVVGKFFKGIDQD